jgi:hypothetical protein
MIDKIALLSVAVLDTSFYNIRTLLTIFDEKDPRQLIQKYMHKFYNIRAETKRSQSL